jgi:hypothetical protein
LRPFANNAAGLLFRARSQPPLVVEQLGYLDDDGRFLNFDCGRFALIDDIK